jgi:pimeloyl-ACP methyl ester carboxylesterase
MPPVGRAWSRRLVVVAAVVGLGALAPAALAGPLGRCSTDANDSKLCGRIVVPLDRTGVVPGSVSLRVRELPPTGSHPSPPIGTVLALAGGPGQAAAPLLETFADSLGPALRSRTLVTFDQRGTGGSGELTCSGLSQAASESAAVGQCARELGPRRIAYTTDESVQDIEAVRAALGVERLILYGTSYGTKVALAYAAAYPQHVERLVLDSVVAPEGIDPFQRTTIASIPRVLRTLCAHRCSFARNPVAELAALVRRLARAPLRGAVFDGSGHSHRASVAGEDLLNLLIAGDLDPLQRAAFPAAVHAALHGDAAPLLRLVWGVGSVGGPATGADSDALFLATSCEDGAVPWALGTPLAQRRAAVDAAAAALPEAAFAPFDRATVRAFGIADLCRAWPESPIVQPRPSLPATSTLILSGDDDLRTPRADALALAARLPDTRLLQVPDTGHSVLGDDPTSCSESAVVAFLDGAAPRRCRAHARVLPTFAPPPRSLAAVHAVRGLPRRAGRTLGAVVLTLGDTTDEIVAQVGAGAGAARAFGGLRAGSARLERGRGVRLRGYAYVPGVTLTGLLATRAKRFTLTVGGKAAMHGRLTFSAKGVTGTLGGKPVHVAAKALGTSATAAAADAALGSFRARPALAAELPALHLPPRWR